MKTALEIFTATSTPFTAALENAPNQACTISVSQAEFVVFTASVVELVAAAKQYENNSILPGHLLTADFRSTLGKMEIDWANVTTTDAGTLMSFFGSAATFLMAYNALTEASTAALPLVFGKHGR
jgi:hypothetical protein